MFVFTIKEARKTFKNWGFEILREEKSSVYGCTVEDVE